MRYILWFLFITMSACMISTHDYSHEQQDIQFRKDYHKIVQELKGMIARDQALRLYFTYGTADSAKVDSIRNRQMGNGMNVDSFELVGSYLTLSQLDSVEQEFSKQDSIHTARIVEMISIYGYPSPKIRMNDTTAHVDPFLILHHPHLYFKDTLLTLLANEVKLKRVDSTTYKMLVWDLNGRNGLPPGAEGITIMKMNENGSVYTVHQ